MACLTSLVSLVLIRLGLDVESEHGVSDIQTNVTHDDEMVTGKIALAVLNEFLDIQD
jgi:hypothetical protein